MFEQLSKQKVLSKAATGWSVFASGVDFRRVLSGPPDRC